jgi:hypothetical protein
MIDYIYTGSCYILENISFQEDLGNPDYLKMLRLVESGDAVIIDQSGDLLLEIKQSELKTIRNKHRDKGFVYKNVNISADRKTQNDITSILSFMTCGILADDTIISWKVSRGVYISLDGIEDVKMFVGSMGVYIQKCFKAESEVNVLLEKNPDMNIEDEFKKIMDR